VEELAEDYWGWWCLGSGGREVVGQFRLHRYSGEGRWWVGILDGMVG
jgi:hypothetical protein